MDDLSLFMDKTLDNFASEKINTVANGLLGSYDKDGNYTISEPIKKELLALVKYKKTTFNNSLFCVAKQLGLGELVFKIDYEKNSKNNVAKATLYLLENVYKVNGYLQDTVKTEIAEYVGDINGFIENSYAKFNVTTQVFDNDDDDGRDYIDGQAPPVFAYITVQKQFVDALNKLTTDKYNKLYEEFFTEKLKVINALGTEFSRAVLNDFRNEYTKVEKFFLNNKDYKALSELLDVCVERNRLSKEPVTPEEKKQFDQEQQYFGTINKATQVFVKKAEAIHSNAVEKAKSRLEDVQQQQLQEIEGNVKPAPANSHEVPTAPKPAAKVSESAPKPTPATKVEAPAKEGKPAPASKPAEPKTKEDKHFDGATIDIDAMAYFHSIRQEKKQEQAKQSGEDKITIQQVPNSQPEAKPAEPKESADKPKEQQQPVNFSDLADLALGSEDNTLTPNINKTQENSNDVNVQEALTGQDLSL